ncbi:MAG TPA: Gfo/Idh/MocA family oxidoreductase [Anaerovoracaceae bacterium]|nr:Gfo/Idh/MocA family oxidoreductase [Anaerovoracaceae bacterium]
MQRNLILIGSGAWGRNYISTLSNFDNISLQVANRDNWKGLIDQKPDGVLIATPPDSHIEIASYALSKDIPTMIEKPICFSSKELKKLSKFSVPILINYSMLFTQVFEELIYGISRPKIEMRFYNSGPIRSYSSLWDYGSHVFALLFTLLDKFKFSIEQTETQPGQFLYHIVSDEADCWFGNGSDVKVNNYQVEADGLFISYDDVSRPKDHKPPLTNALQVFLRCLEGEKDWRMGLDLSLKVTKALETCEKRLAKL